MSDENESVNILVYNCTKSMAMMIQDMRDEGRIYRYIAKRMGFSVHAVTRYHRLYEKFGIEVFADDK
jgi:hypothetical protein